MFLIERLRSGKRRERRLRDQAMSRHNALADRVLALSGADWLDLKDDFNIRFELIVLWVTAQLFVFRKGGETDAEERITHLWEAMFEGFDYSLREQGVTDIRIGARMRKLLTNATGRRNAYLTALDKGEGETLRAAVARNVLNGADPEDARIPRLVEALRADFSLIADRLDRGGEKISAADPVAEKDAAADQG